MRPYTQIMVAFRLAMEPAHKHAALVPGMGALRMDHATLLTPVTEFDRKAGSKRRCAGATTERTGI